MSTACFSVWTNSYSAERIEIYSFLEARFLSPAASAAGRAAVGPRASCMAAGEGPQSTAMAREWDGLWELLHGGIRVLKRQGDLFPACFLLDDSSSQSAHLAEALVGLSVPRPYTLVGLVCDRAAARLALDEELRQGHLLADARGADPDDGFWVVLVRGRTLRCGLATVRSGQPRPLRSLEVTF
jgi:hypothetical protein